MTSITLSEEKVRAIILQVYKTGYNDAISISGADPRGKIELGKIKSFGKSSDYFAMTQDGSPLITYDNCAKVESKSIDCFSIHDREGLIRVLSEITNLIKKAEEVSFDNANKHTGLID